MGVVVSPGADLGAGMDLEGGVDLGGDMEPDMRCEDGRDDRSVVQEAGRECGLAQAPDLCGVVREVDLGQGCEEPKVCGGFGDSNRCEFPKDWMFNPYYKTATWKLWAVDGTGVDTTGWPGGLDGVKEPVEAGKRLFPQEMAPLPREGKFLATATMQTRGAGWWDDAFASLDNGHTGFRGNYNKSGGSIRLRDQIIAYNKGTLTFQQRIALGVSFTSQSYSQRGHGIVNDRFNSGDTERTFAFVNTIRGTPSYRSFRETIPSRMNDQYDALFAHSFQSVGRSGSELGALDKMLIAAGFYTPALKLLLKSQGVYALINLLLWRQALPYADAGGAALPYAHELRHRPAYLSYGDSAPTEFVPRNTWYHRYPEAQHMFSMAQTASSLEHAPPVTLLKVEEVSIKDDKGMDVPKNMGMIHEADTTSKTMARIHGAQGQTLRAVVDLRGSFDLERQPLTFSAQRVYFNQKHITITQLEPGRFELLAAYDPKMPKGRSPVILWASDGELDGTPVFVNFYWLPQGQQPSEDSYVEEDSDLLKQVTLNKRPILKANGSEADSVMALAAEQKVSMKVECSDPEGFDTAIYRWLGDPGTLDPTSGAFTFTAPKVTEATTLPLHFICSDGTGAYQSIQVKLEISP